ncbi:hypothetical protein J6590_079062 [Homalodisca vitripennis]|nr:hypothetical protein J6590_079062 [Homalodisca vitripennis]
MRLARVQLQAALRLCSTYRIVSELVVLVITAIIPVELGEEHNIPDDIGKDTARLEWGSLTVRIPGTFDCVIQQTSQTMGEKAVRQIGLIPYPVLHMSRLLQVVLASDVQPRSLDFRDYRRGRLYSAALVGEGPAWRPIVHLLLKITSDVSKICASEAQRVATETPSNESDVCDMRQRAAQRDNEITSNESDVCKICGSRVATENDEQRERRLQDMRQRASQRVAPENNERRLQDMRHREAQRREAQIVATETSEQRERRLQDMRQRTAYRVANENDKQRERRLQNMRQRASQPVGTENDEQREQNLQEMQQRASQRVATENNERRERHLQDMRHRVAQRVANENYQQRERHLQDMRQREAQRVATENYEQRERRLQDMRQTVAQRVATGNDEQRERRL